MATGKFSRAITAINTLLDELEAARGGYGTLSDAISAKANETDLNALIAYTYAFAKISAYYKYNSSNKVAFTLEADYTGEETSDIGVLVWRGADYKNLLTHDLKAQDSTIVELAGRTSGEPAVISDNAGGIYIRPYIKIGNRYKYGDQISTTYSDAFDPPELQMMRGADTDDDIALGMKKSEVIRDAAE